MVALSSAKQ